MKRTRVAIAGVGAAMLIGAGAGLAVTLPSGAGASSDSTVATSDTTNTSDTTSATTDTTAQDEHGRLGGPLKDALGVLVTAGTITQEQADTIIAAIEANRPSGERPEIGDGREGDHFRPGKGGFGRGFGALGKGLDAAANAIGITTVELLTEIKAGKTIAAVAGEKGVDVQTVIDAIVAAETAQLTETVTNVVNGVRPAHPSDNDNGDDSTDSSTTTTTG